MKTTNGTTDPLQPVYAQGGTSTQRAKRGGGFGSRTNVMVLIILAVVVGVVIVLLGREKPAPEVAAPEATEVR